MSICVSTITSGVITLLYSYTYNFSNCLFTIRTWNCNIELAVYNYMYLNLQHNNYEWNEDSIHNLR